MLNKVIKIFGIVLLEIGLFAILPLSLYAYYGPSASTINATNITATNATMNGAADTGGEPGNAWFEYGTDVNFGNSTTLDAFNWNSGYSGRYSTNISGLTANTTYYFRAVAQNSQGRAYGNVVSFTTSFSILGNNNSLSPTAITTSGSILADNTAQLNALILTGNTNKTNTWFEWGVTPNLGNQTVSLPIGGAPAIRHTNTLTGLAPGTTYYFRAVAQNDYGLNTGNILNLTTSGAIKGPALPGNSANTGSNAAKITSTDTTTVEKNTNDSSSTSALGANALSAGSFFPTNLLGWLILFIFVLILILLSKRAYSQFKKS